MDQIEVFISYAHEDEKLAQELLKHLRYLEAQIPFAYIWSSNDILPGQNAKQTIREHLEEAKIILLLVSPDLLHSKEDELALIEVKYRNNIARIIPIIIRPTDWSQTFFAHLKSLPASAKPLSISKSPTLTYREIIKGVEVAVKNYMHTDGDIKMASSKEGDQHLRYKYMEG